MGLLDALTSIAGGASSEHSGVADALSQVMQEHPGGMDGILGQLKQNGLAEQVQSWVSPGENKSITPDQVCLLYTSVDRDWHRALRHTVPHTSCPQPGRRARYICEELIP